MRADIEESATKKNQQDSSPWHSKEPVGCSFLWTTLQIVEWPTSIFSKQNQYIINGKGYENWLNDHQRGNALIFYQILPTYFLRKCIDNSLENLYVDIGA